MTRWDPGNKLQILQSIADDQRRPAHEREAARRELAVTPGVQAATPSSKRGRNSNVPQTQADIDCDIETHFRNLHDDRLDGQARREIEMDLPESTRQILAAFGNRILWLFHDNEAELDLMIGLYQRTQSDFVKNKALEVITHISKYSPIPAARQQASQFLTQIDSTTQETNDNE